MICFKDSVSYFVSNSQARIVVKRYIATKGLQVIYDCVSSGFVESLWRLMDYSNSCLGAHRDGTSIHGIGVVESESAEPFELRPWKPETERIGDRLVMHERNALERVVGMHNQIVYPILRQ